MEMVVVMVVLCMMLAASMAFLGGGDTEGKLRECADDFETMAREAQARAIMTHTTYKVALLPGKIRMFDETQRTADMRDFVENEAKKEIEFRNEDVGYAVQRWGRTDWVEPTELRPIVWVFAPNGFVEPISVKFSLKGAKPGENYLKQTYHPLTASVIEEEMDVR